MVQPYGEKKHRVKDDHPADHLRQTDQDKLTQSINVITNYLKLGMGDVAHRSIAICKMKSSWFMSWLHKDSLAFACSSIRKYRPNSQTNKDKLVMWHIRVNNSVNWQKNLHGSGWSILSLLTYEQKLVSNRQPNGNCILTSVSNHLPFKAALGWTNSVFCGVFFCFFPSDFSTRVCKQYD